MASAGLQGDSGRKARLHAFCSAFHEHAGGGAVGGVLWCHLTAEGFAEEAQRHHGAVVAVDVRRGVHGLWGAVDGVVGRADVHDDARAAVNGGDGLGGVVIIHRATKGFCQQAVWNVGAAASDNWLGVGDVADAIDGVVFIEDLDLDFVLCFWCFVVLS